MPDRDTLMRRIKKLLALAADNPDSPESQAAAAKAGQLMSEYQIEFASIEMEEDEIIQDASPNYMEEDTKWSHSLITIIGETFNCKTIKSNNAFHIIGYKHDVELAKWMFGYLRTIISRKADDNCNGARQRSNFGMGFVASVYKRLKEVFETRKEHMGEQTSALVVQKNNKVDDKYHQLFPKSRTSRSSYRMDGSYFKGKEYGSKIPLSRPVYGGKSTQMAIH